MPATPYSSSYKRKLAGLLSGPAVPCTHCRRRQAVTLDHYPPLGMHAHRPDTDCCRLLPSCSECNSRGGQMVANGTWRPNAVLAALEAEPERQGLDAGDRRWRVDWLAELVDVPADGGWARLMTVPHRRATGSLGAEFAAWSEAREGRGLRWWQRLVAARLLETDRDGRLVWETATLSTARQVGKSWLLRELCLWRGAIGGGCGGGAVERGRRSGGPRARPEHRQGPRRLKGDPAAAGVVGEGPPRRPLQG